MTYTVEVKFVGEGYATRYVKVEATTPDEARVLAYERYVKQITVGEAVPA